MTDIKAEVPRVIYRRKWVTLEKKLDIIKSHESGKTNAKIAREYAMNESSIRAILRKKEQYKQQAASTASLLSKSVARQRSPRMVTMERQLIAWIEDCNQKRIQLTENKIQRKALSLFNELKKDGGDSKEKFTASRGWFYRFQNRINLQNYVISGDKTTPDVDAAARFCTEFKNLVDGYSHQQIFNVDETILYWKKIPSESFLKETEKSLQGYKPSKDSLTLLLGSNASGDLKLKPLVVFRAQTPSALRDCKKTSLPVIWHSNKKAWLNKDIFAHWFANYFCPTVETYCHEQCIEFKVLLLLDSAPSHDIPYCNDHVKVVFLPSNTACLLQPMSQGIFSTFKSYYLRQIFSQAIESAPAVEPSSFVEFWKSYNIKNAIHNISASWCEISTGDLISVWHRVLPGVENNNLENQIDVVSQDLITMGKYFGLYNLDLPNAQNESVVNESEEQNVEVEVEEPIICKEEIPEVEEYEFEEGIRVGDLEKILDGVDTACEAILAADPDVERSIKVRQVLQNGIEVYRDLYFEAKKRRSV